MKEIDYKLRNAIYKALGGYCDCCEEGECPKMPEPTLNQLLQALGKRRFIAICSNGMFRDENGMMITMKRYVFTKSLYQQKQETKEKLLELLI